ncbi:hypothetical protein GK047_21995 [Paenibacillus sp. SYP-B3998]|uniref:Uncharacterized protein n=1 Tax=Paenibacillus sp. SYP-B3998 TaxID=2678564 RepID=A0A6G4A2Q8_9BACL|nr:hypothetical protein [Paenibacillus sp. SYP-B3998]NEW08672.1 hypothetical protein [Paenibacillus sp. SYP-B3998]
MTKPNQECFDVLERGIQRVEQWIHVEHRGAPPASEVPKIGKEIFWLQGA